MLSSPEVALRGPEIRVLPEIAAALEAGDPVVALETSVLAQGLPIPANREACERMIAAVEREGAAAALTAVVQGVPTLGLTAEEVERFLARTGVKKVSARDLAWASVHGIDGATTVAGALTIAASTGCAVFATGGIGGVHRQPAFDESADLIELSRVPLLVVCSGAKSILDLPATVERLESYGVPVIGYRTGELPGFFTAQTGIALDASADTVEQIADAFIAHRALARPSAMLVVQPPPAETALPRSVVDRAVERAVRAAEEGRVRGSAVTPFLLAEVERATEGRSLRANLALLEANAQLASALAAAVTARTRLQH